MLNPNKASRDVPFLYWTAAALGLAISVSKDDATMLSRIPEVEAMLNRAIELDPDFPNSYYNLGLTHALISEFREAVQFLKKYRDLTPAEDHQHTNDLIAKLSSQLHSLRKNS